MQTRVSRRNYVFGLGSWLLATACVSTRLEPSADHPANARAETAPMPTQQNILTSVPPANPPSISVAPDEHGHEHGQQPQDAAPSADTYTCSMHPQIVKNAPGNCPICGMKLIKKSSPKQEGAAP
ncbi:MAG TPA: heavy metal-binding domain-containing protein [Polyangiaceae bacterium]|nr:heavy metal-binding domain-containing protein [Polyangiaceae bacterium]